MTDPFEHESDLIRYVARVVGPRAERADLDATLDPAMLKVLGEAGLLGAAIPREYGGLGFDEHRFGQLCAAVGSWCTSTRALLTVQDMVAGALLRYGTDRHRTELVPRLARGELIAAFALTEPAVGSDAAAVSAPLTAAEGGWRLQGEKRWTSLATIADVFLVIGRAPEGPTAVLVERDADGLTVAPVGARVLGMRAAMTAHLSFDDCFVSDASVVGGVGTGFSFVANTALDRGRHSVAWGSVGLAEGVLREATRHASRREQFGSVLTEHQLVRRLLTDMLLRARSARLVCDSAARARDGRSVDAVLETVLAKYAAAQAAFDNAAAAVQVLGSYGCEGGTLVERMFRDAKIQQLIEGTDQLAQLQLWELAARDVHRYDRLVSA